MALLQVKRSPVVLQILYEPVEVQPQRRSVWRSTPGPTVSLPMFPFPCRAAPGSSRSLGNRSKNRRQKAGTAEPWNALEPCPRGPCDRPAAWRKSAGAWQRDSESRGGPKQAPAWTVPAGPHSSSMSVAPNSKIPSCCLEQSTRSSLPLLGNWEAKNPPPDRCEGPAKTFPG